MALLPMFPELLKQLFRTPATNKFPAKYLPPSVTAFLEKVGAGQATLVPPVPTPPKFRGKIEYQRDGCIGCNLCVKVCLQQANYEFASQFPWSRTAQRLQEVYDAVACPT